MTSEFDPIDPRQIIQQLVQSVDVPHMDAPPPQAGLDGDAGPLPDEMQHGMPPGMPPPSGADQEVHVHGDDSDVHVHDDDSDNDGPFPKGEKQKAKDDKDKSKKKGPPKKDDKAEKAEKDETKEAAFRARRLRKFADVLEDQYKQAEWAFEDAFANLQRQLNRAHGAPSMEAFEKDALALHGDNEVGVAMLNMVRTDRGMPALEFNAARTKTAALADRHVVEETEATQVFDQIVKIATEALKLQQGAAHVRTLCD
jgi:hypothetical protein